MSKLMFFGTPQFAVPSLKALSEFCRSNSHHLVGVVCQPDKPAQRGQQIQMPAVKQEAILLDLQVWQPQKITPEFIEWFKNQKIDLAVVVVYGKILPQSLLDASRLGFVNIHPSLLPRWRGAAPIQRALQAGDTETGICIMNLIAEMDAGEIYRQIRTPIDSQETSSELFERLSTLGAQTLIETLPSILEQILPKIPQNKTGLTLAPRLKKEEGHIDWTKSAYQVVNHCRAMNPWPGSYAFYEGKKIKLFKAQMKEGPATHPGQIQEVSENLVVATAKGLVAFQEAQLEGKRRMSIRDLSNGFPMQIGACLC